LERVCKRVVWEVRSKLLRLMRAQTISTIVTKNNIMCVFEPDKVKHEGTHGPQQPLVLL